ncbi:MAG: hypothetical protein AAGE59_21820, partial [Cyanobacteria bacterium P01_F01_bin.86]
ASVAAGTPPSTTPPRTKGRTGNVTVLEIQQLVPNGQPKKRAMQNLDWHAPLLKGVGGIKPLSPMVKT